MRLFDPRERRARRGERDRPIHCRLRTPLPRREVGILLRSLFLYLPSPRSLIRRPWATSTHFLRFPRQQQIAVRRRGHGGPRLQDRYLLLLAVREQRHRRLLRRGRFTWTPIAALAASCYSSAACPFPISRSGTCSIQDRKILDVRFRSRAVHFDHW